MSAIPIVVLSADTVAHWCIDSVLWVVYVSGVSAVFVSHLSPQWCRVRERKTVWYIVGFSLSFSRLLAAYPSKFSLVRLLLYVYLCLL